MSNYVPATDFAAKDNLASGTPAKSGKGADIANELAAIQTAIATKYDEGDTIIHTGGSANAPGLATTVSPTTGMFSASPGVIGFSILGSQVFTMSVADGFNSGTFIQIPDGHVGNLTLRFSADPDVGAYRFGADQMRFACGGIDVVALQKSGGVGVFSLLNHTTATSATGGAASALPGLPVGYIQININGVVRRVPYYD